MTIQRFLIAVLLVGWGMSAGIAHAQIFVVTNRTAQPITFTVTPLTAEGTAVASEKPQPQRLLPAELLAIPLEQTGQLAFEEERLLVESEQAYYFIQQDDEIRFLRIDLGQGPDRAQRIDTGGKLTQLKVKVLVDDEELATERVWRQRLERRLAQASEVLQRTCRVQLIVNAWGTWDSDDDLFGFPEALRELSEEIDPDESHLVIGFSGQSREPAEDGRLHLGGARGTLHSHLLIREWVRGMSEPEKLEVLLHELGHYLGAMHVDDPYSVMRPRLADRRARSRQFSIAFDPLNALIMNHVVQELGRGKKPDQFSDYGKARIAQLREILQPTGAVRPQIASNPPVRTNPQPMPEPRTNDNRPTTPRPANPKTNPESNPRVANPTPANPAPGADKGPAPPANPEAYAAATRHILMVFWKEPPAELRGDAVLEHYMKQAARAANGLPPHLRRRAFVMAIGIGLDDSAMLRDFPLTASFCRSVEAPDEWAVRRLHVRPATFKGRRDHAQHFCVSAFLTAFAGKTTAAAAGLMKELMDAQGGSGFSQDDLVADRLGIEFAQSMLDGNKTLSGVASGFRTSDFPDPRQR